MMYICRTKQKWKLSNVNTDGSNERINLTSRLYAIDFFCIITIIIWCRDQDQYCNGKRNKTSTSNKKSKSRTGNKTF